MNQVKHWLESNSFTLNYSKYINFKINNVKNDSFDIQIQE